MLERIRQQIAARNPIGKRRDSPHIELRDNGMPHITKLYEGPTNYAKVFERSIWSSVSGILGGTEEDNSNLIENRQEFKDLQSFFKEHRGGLGYSGSFS